MTTSESRLDYLYRQYTGKTCTQQEMEEFFEYVRDPAYREVLEAMADHQIETMGISADLPVVDWEHMYRSVMPSPEPERKERRAPVFTLARAAAAACILLVVMGGLLFLNRRPHRDGRPDIVQKEIAPGFNNAVLTLADGMKITLDSAHTGELTKQGDVAVVNSGNGSLSYDGSGKTSANVLYNTLTTPRGGQYQLLLPDGTKVWLNAASSITYPTAFTGEERMVKLTGEAYFEVVHDKNKPFRVKAGNQLIEDIGTHFNINAYTDEPSQVTTLLEGIVKVGERVLKPGEQASVAISGEVIVSRGDLVQAVAWKNGFFDFSDASLQMVMRQLARWYNVEVEYEGTIRQRQFTGMIGRALTLGQVLRGLTSEGVHYRIEANNHLIITP
jgi:transmembrane sensor